MYAIKACLFSKLFHCNVSFQVMLEKRQSPIYFPPAETNNPDNEETPVASPVASEQGHSHLLRVTGNGIPPANELQTFAVIPSHSYYFWYGDFNVENNIADTCGSRFYYSRWRPFPYELDARHFSKESTYRQLPGMSAFPHFTHSLGYVGDTVCEE